MIKRWQERCLIGQAYPFILLRDAQLEKEDGREDKKRSQPIREGIQGKKKEKEKEKERLGESKNLQTFFMYYTLGNKVYKSKFLIQPSLSFNQLSNLLIVDFSYVLKNQLGRSRSILSVLSFLMPTLCIMEPLPIVVDLVQFIVAAKMEFTHVYIII